MHVLVVGTGAVGGYFGGLLAASGRAVTFVARGENADCLQRGGLLIQGASEARRIAVRVVRHVKPEELEPVSVVIVAVKSRNLGEVAGVLTPLVSSPRHPQALVLPLLNGLESERFLALRLGPPRVIGGVAMIAASRPEPGRVLAPHGGSLVLAPCLPEQRSAVAALVEDWGQAFPCRLAEDLAHVLWSKLLWNAPFNAVCALTGLPAGRVLDVPGVEALVRAVMREVQAVARAEGVLLADAELERMVRVTREAFPNTIPSMRQDLEAGLPTEVEELQGVVVERAARVGLGAPLTAALAALVRGLEMRAQTANREGSGGVT
jgi:2-dehydropantoate 2-reductase